MRVLVETLFGPIAFEGLGDKIIFLTSISSVGLQKKRIYISSVKLRSLSKILDGATLGNFFKEIRFFTPFHVLLKSIRLF